MGTTPSRPTPERRARLLDELHRDQDLRRQSYRDRDLRLLPHVCARCAREFSGKRLRELTVHHKDHDYKNNPPDGSNWELLCLYCHDDEHEKTLRASQVSDVPTDLNPAQPSLANPFEGLDTLLKPE
jgi:predicted amidophosphoribosyltransferase